MKFETSQKIVALSFIAAFALMITFSFSSCGGGSGSQQIGNAQTPTEAYKMLFAAVKSKDNEKIKKMMSQNSLTFAQAAASQQNKPVEKVLENGFYASTMSANLPNIRDERVQDNFGAVEVWNEKDRIWEEVSFVKEDDGWKVAVGDLFRGTYQSPGKSQTIREQEAANIANPNQAVIPGNVNTNVDLNKIPVTKVTPPLANKTDDSTGAKSGEKKK